MNTVKLGKGYDSVRELFESELGPASPEEEKAYQREEAVQEIASVLFAMRTAKNVSREALAAKTGMSVDDIVRLESYGETVKFADVQRIAAALDYHVTLRVTEGVEPAEAISLSSV